MAFHDSRHTGQTSEVVTPPLSLAWTWVDTIAYDNDPKWHAAQHFWLPIYYRGKVCLQGGRNANRVFCLNPSDGTKIWEQDNSGYANAGTYLFQFDNYPAAVNGRIINASTDFTASMDAATGGDVQVSYNTNGGWPAGGVASWNNMAYIQFLRSDDGTEGYYLAQDPVKLSLGGTYYTPDNVNTFIDYSTRVPAVDAGVSYVSMMGVLWAIEARTSRILWTWGKQNNNASPAVSNGIVYFYTSSNYMLSALDANHVNYNSTTGTQVPTLWSISLPGAYSPIVSDGTVYVGSADGNFYALDAATGATKWSFPAGIFSFTQFQIPAISGDLLYVPSNNGILYVLDKHTGQEKWRYTGSYPFGPVVVANGMVFVSDRHFTFYAFRPQTAAIGPAVTALSTTRGANGQPVSLTITGSGFFAGGATNQVQSIHLDNPSATQITGYTVATDQSITGVVIPAGIAPGVYHLRVQTNVGQSVNEPTFQVVAANSFFPSVIGQSSGPCFPGTAVQWQRHLVRTSTGTLIAVYPGPAEDGGPQDPTYNVSHDGGLTWNGQSTLSWSWYNFVSKWAPTSSLWVDGHDHLNSSYVQWGTAGQSFEKFALNGMDFLLPDPGFPVFPTSASSTTAGTVVGQTSGRLWEAFEIGGQVTPFYSDNGGQAWTRLPAVNQAAGNSPSLVLYQSQPAIFYNEGTAFAWSLWNGQQWSARQILPGPINGVQSFSAVATANGQLHLVYVTSGGVAYISYSGSTWSAPQTLDAAGSSPSLTTDGTSLWCVYANSSGDLVYRRTSNAQWNPAVAITSDGNYNTAPSTLVLSPDAKIPVIWTSGPSTNQTVNAALIAGDGPPSGVTSGSTPQDVSRQVKVTSTGFLMNRATRIWTATMMVTNTSSATIQGPIETVLSNLSANAAMVNAIGTSNGSPYIKVSSAPLAPGSMASVQIQFTNPTNGFINFTPVTLSGAF